MSLISTFNDEQHNTIVTGYIRSIKKQKEPPKEIENLCFTFYSIFNEKFKCRPQQTAITAADCESKTYYGNVINFNDTSITKYIWWFKLLQLSDELKEFDWIKIGLESVYTKSECISFHLRRYLLEFDSFYGYKYHGSSAKSGDKIRIVLDVKRKEIRFHVNGNRILRKRCVLFHEHTTLRMAVHLPTKAKIEFYNFIIHKT